VTLIGSNAWAIEFQAREEPKKEPVEFMKAETGHDYSDWE